MTREELPYPTPPGSFVKFVPRSYNLPCIEMPLTRTLAIAQKELHHIIRDPRLLFLVILSPAFLLIVLSYVFSFEVERVDLTVMDLDKSPLSRSYISTLTSDNEFHVVAYAPSYETLHRLILSGDADVALVIPHGFGSLQALVDGADPISARQTIGHLAARTTAFALSLSTSASLGVRSQAWYNPSLKSLVSMVPGLMAIVLCVPALAVALAMTREREWGTLEVLLTTPLRGWEYLVGKLTAYMATGLLSAMLTTLVAVFWFHVSLRGNLLLLLLLSLDYFLAAMGLSLFISNFTSSQQTAFIIVLFIFFVPSFFIAGLILPVDTESLFSQVAAYSLPATHFVTICRGIFLKGSSLPDLWFPAAILAAMGATAVGLSVLSFKKWMY
jgi:ABC-2 type transport system permease protein